MKICLITCYNQPDYIRAKTLRSAAAMVEGADVVIVKNTQTGSMRYPEVFFKLLKARISQKPDAYLLTFRGYEMLLPVRLLSIGRPLIYDEFINPIEWVSYEHKKIGKYNPITWMLWVYYRLLLSVTELILTDTQSHADLSARMMKVRRDKFVTLPVATDESLFTAHANEEIENDMFTVFYYGNMLPLHGLKYVIEAAVLMNHEPIKFVLVGGNAKTAHDVAVAVGNGAKIEYKAWVEFEQLPRLMREADLCLAGPFGDTFQAQYVITGKAYQYMAMGRPIVVGKNLESDVFTHKKNALIAKQGDATALVEVLTWAMNNRTDLEPIGKAGKKLYEEELSVRVVAERLSKGLAGLGLTELAAGADGKQKQE